MRINGICPEIIHIICVRVQKWSQAKGCSVTTSKRKEEITIKPKKTTICKHLLGSQQVSNWLWISNLDSVAVSAQDNAVLWEIKASNKSDSCCFQVQLLSPCHLLLQTGREQLPPAPGGSHRSQNLTERRKPFVFWPTDTHSTTETPSVCL